MENVKSELKDLLETLEEAEEFYDLGKHGSMLRKVLESKQRVSKLIEQIENS